MKSGKLLLVAAFFFICGNILAQNTAKEGDMTQMMVNMTPGEIQKMMAKRTGEWTAVMTMWMDPAQPPAKQEAKVHNEMMMDRYLTSRYTSTMMGMPFSGMATMAYDNGTKKYYMTWMDNMGTGMTQMSGTYNESTQTIELKGISQDPMTGKEIQMRQTIKMIDDKTEHMEMFGPGMDGKEMKMMEIDLIKN